ncbi:twin-arginine translocase TatA/TatE family subunit [Flavicella sp.]|uniref:twin-arginine translocase TatA/TatE family subunit n=1 Tax=Flavicella sp. TaxID=2957742 RepID=UPI0030194ADB
MNLSSIFLGMIGPPQVILIIVVVLLLFGGRKIPELMKGLGGGIKEFKKAAKEEDIDNKEKDDKTKK